VLQDQHSRPGAADHRNTGLEMILRNSYDAVVIGSGPNGLAAAIRLAQSGLSVVVFEANSTIGGGARSAELTLPGFRHDICSAVHPMGVASPFFKSLNLERHGLEWLQPPAPLAHPLDDGTAVILERSVEVTAEALGVDAAVYRRLVQPLVKDWPSIDTALLGPLRPPRHPFAMARFGLNALRTAQGLVQREFHALRARALFAGLAAHSILSFDRLPSAAIALVLGAIGHVSGWPIPRGGSESISHALAECLRSLGGEIVTGTRVESLDQLPQRRAVLCDITPRQLLRLAGNQLTPRYRRALERYRYGPGAYKVDWALSAPIPWKARECARAATVHIGGTYEEIAASEKDAWEGRTSERPFVLLAQPTLFDSARAPAGKHIAWGYCHVPNGSGFSMLDRIEAQIERFAPGFRDVIQARSVMAPQDLERHNPNLVGGDIGGGVADVRQLFTRPTIRNYSTSAPGLYLCSSSTPPGAGVHGMCGYHAAGVALKQVFGRRA
jgi:phytoene dehydrogenase-like protein